MSLQLPPADFELLGNLVRALYAHPFDEPAVKRYTHSIYETTGLRSPCRVGVQRLLTGTGK